MSQEITNQIINSEESLESAFMISATLASARKALFNKFKPDLISWAEQQNLKVTDDKWGEDKESHIYFESKDTKLSIPFFFAFDNYFNSFSVGVKLQQNHEGQLPLKKMISDKLSAIAMFGNDRNNPHYTYLYYFRDNWARWDDYKFMWKGMITGETKKQFQKWIQDIVKELETVETEFENTNKNLSA